jgi:putative nucleotidyltransferase with HDIG domain
VSQERIHNALHRLETLPALPSVVTQVMETAADPSASALDLARPILADQSLSAQLLRIVNSAYYGFYRKIASVSEAIVILGFAEVRGLVMAASSFDTFPKSETAFDRLQLWRHSVAVAFAAERIARRTPIAPEWNPFSAGLLHDMGKVALDVVDPAHFMQTVGAAREQEVHVTVAEETLETVPHAAAGAALAEHWNLPQQLVEAVQYHHNPEDAPEFATLAHITCLADAVTYLAELGESSNGARAPVHPASLEALKLDDAAVAAVTDDLAESRERIDGLLGVLVAD